MLVTASGGMGMNVRAQEAGLSMVELMVTLFVMAILMAVAVPRFRDVMARGDVAKAMNALSADMQFARGQAAAQHRFVSICRSTTGTSCAEATSSPFDYDAGWMVYSYDVTSDGPNQVYDSSKSNMDILRYTAKVTGVSLRGTDGKLFTFDQRGQFVSSSTRTQLAFVACARKASADGTAATVGTNVSGKQGSQLLLRASGSITVTALPLTNTTCLPS
jgi:type IV fimbrial biogenesis protein FimT